jgi:hypothetical protein
VCDRLDQALRDPAAVSRAAINAEFAQMASDRAYLEEAVQVAEDFAEADWEAWRTAERGS